MKVKETFYVTTKAFSVATQRNSGSEFTSCPDCPSGILYSIEMPRLMWHLGYKRFQCDRCYSVHTVDMGDDR